MTEPKDWIKAHGAKCKQAFGLWDWDIAIEPVERISKMKDGMVAGQAQVTYQYLSSTVKLRTDIPETEYGHKIVTHEFLHIAIADLDRAVANILPFIPKKYRAYCEGIFDMGKERTIEKLAIHLTPLLMAMKEGE